MHIYGFQRITKGVDKNCYHHEHFLRGHHDLITKITRCPVKNGVRPLTMASTTPQPDFYAMPALSTSTKQRTCVEGDSSADGTPANNNVTSHSQLKPQSVSQFIQNHITDTQNARNSSAAISAIQSEALPITASAPNNSFAAALPAAALDPSIMSLLERLQGITAAQNGVVSSQGSNFTTSIRSQNQRDNHLNAALNHVSDQRSEMNLFTSLSAQAEQNRAQLQSFINRSQVSQLSLSMNPPEPQLTGSARSLLLQRLAQRVPSFYDDMGPLQHGFDNAFSNENIGHNAIAALTSSMIQQPPPPPTDTNGVRPQYGGSTNLLGSVHDDPLIRFLAAHTGSTSTASPIAAYIASNSSNSTVATSTGTSFTVNEFAALRNQLWNPRGR